MKTTNDLVIGQLVKVVKHSRVKDDPDTHLSNYPGFEIGTVHSVCDNSDATGGSVMVGIGLDSVIVEAEEIELCID